MNTEKMTIHKALCELKTLDARIRDAINGATFCIANKHSNQKIGGKPISDVSAAISAKYQSITDLINRRNAIKRAVVLSNAVTKVVVGGKEYTVAEAIEMKNNGIGLLTSLIAKMANDLRNATFECERNSGDRLEQRADEYLKAMFQGFDAKNISAEMKSARDAFVAAQTMELVDPIDVSAKVEALDKQRSEFMVEVDSALSVSNAITEIEISY